MTQTVRLTTNTASRAEMIRSLNDHFRRSGNPEMGRIIFTQGAARVGEFQSEFESHAHIAQIANAVRTYDAFTPDNDPHGEHDFGDFEISGERYFWKIDYYNRELTGWESPLSSQCVRVLTVMLTSEY